MNTAWRVFALRRITRHREGSMVGRSAFLTRAAHDESFFLRMLAYPAQMTAINAYLFLCTSRIVFVSVAWL